MSTPRKRLRRKLLMFALPIGARVMCRIHVDCGDPSKLAASRWAEAKVTAAGGLHGDDITIVEGPDRRTHYKTLQRMWVSSRPGWKRADQAATHLNRHGLWWWDQDGAPVRVATTLEVALYDDGVVIGAGFTLATPENEEIPCVKPEIVWRAPIDFCAPIDEQDAKKREQRRAERNDALTHAQACLKRATTREKRATTSRQKWARKVRALERKQ